MKCPIDESTLVMTERTGIEIDYCPTCRGVWLDRGELDKIIERSVEMSGLQASQRKHGGDDGHRGGGHDSWGASGHRSDRDGHGTRPRRRESWLSNLFD